MDNLSPADIEDLIELASSNDYASRGLAECEQPASPWKIFFWFIWMWF